MSRRLFAAATIMLAASTPAFAHGLLMKVAAQGKEIAGELYFSNGQRAGGVWVELFDAANKTTPVVTVQTRPDGTFRLPGQSGRSYEVRATGEEGHGISVTITLDGNQARGAMIEDQLAPADAPSELPAWAVVGGLLLLSTLPALWLRRRRSRHDA